MALLSNPLAAWAEEIVAMRTLAVLSALLAPMTSESATGVGGSAVGQSGLVERRLGWIFVASATLFFLFCDGGSRWGTRYGQ